MLLNLPIHLWRISLYLFVSQRPFIGFSGYVFASLVKFILNYFILFDFVVCGIVFIICFSDIPLLLFWNTTNTYVDFCPAFSLSSFTDFNRCVNIYFYVFNFSVFCILNHSETRNTFTSSFQIWMTLLFNVLTCLGLLVLLKRNGESRCPFPFPHRRGNAFGVSSWIWREP